MDIFQMQPLIKHKYTHFTIKTKYLGITFDQRITCSTNPHAHEKKN